MKYFKARRYSNFINSENEDDPLTGVANLFDVGLVFIVGLFLALISTYNLMDFMSEESEITVMKKDRDGNWEIITKRGKEVKVEKVSNKKTGGREGRKLGTAYKLKNGKVIYVPDRS